ncbi:MAG: prepilin-type N-terminal cleavage/methylation domain-containing protein [Endomicrobia bacterium]|nr:prepilin-type N-terminal cleavage/methylation domain-containing protein [Endomicrobiia bacterium]MCL2799600.1 prepilin-type N-terminal cleavage/methylation domain-containing protein [Endomicrobiia bacterium]
MKKNFGFTLVELIIVIVIVGILSVIGGTLYSRHVRNAKLEEGRQVVREVASAMEIWKERTGDWWPVGATGAIATDSQNDDLGIDLRRNKNYRSFKLSGNSAGATKFTVTASGGPDNVVLEYDVANPAKVSP